MSDLVVSKLAAEWGGCGVTEGDTLLLHSSLGRTLRRLVRMGCQADPKLIIASFLRAVGESGTLILPLFNFDFTTGVTFTVQNSPSQMGVLTEVGRLWPGAVRTGHPIYSFAVIGKNAEMFRGVSNISGYGNDSPFGMLHRLAGKIASLDLSDQNSMTFYHYVEESLKVPYRHHKTFTGQYIDKDDVESTRAFSLFVRNIEQGVVTHVDPMGEILWKNGLYSGCRPQHECGLRVISAAAMFDEVASVIIGGRAEGLLYEIK